MKYYQDLITIIIIVIEIVYHITIKIINLLNSDFYSNLIVIVINLFNDCFINFIKIAKAFFIPFLSIIIITITIFNSFISKH